MQPPKVFVSHSSKDAGFAAKLVDDLNGAGATVWFASNDIEAGDFQQRIDEALAECEWFLLVLTRDALTSYWVKQEVNAANILKHQGQIRDLIIVKADDVPNRDIPPLWRVFNILDANANYTAALNRILKAIGIVPSDITSRLPSSGRPTTEDKRVGWLGRLFHLQVKTADTHVAQGIVFLRYGAYEAALKEFEEALRMDSLNSRAWDGKADALEALGQKRQAQIARSNAKARQG
jgi:tetratricopeptide (TPR) repeat protein